MTLTEDELREIREKCANASERERAKIEDHVWRHSGVGALKAKPIVAKALGATQYEVAMRRNLFLGGDAVAPLWDRIDRGMSYGTAVRIWRNVRQNNAKSSRYAQLVDFLSRYEGGGFDRSHEPRAHVAVSPAAPQPQPQPQPQPSPPPAPPELGPEELGSKDFRKQIHNIVTSHFGMRLARVPAEERERLASEFERDLDGLLTTHQSRIYRAESGENRRRAIGRTELRNACRILHIDPPRKRESLDEFLGKARRQQRELARLYHPDTNRGSNENRPRYEAVIAAFGVVETYIEEQKKIVTPSTDTTPLRVVRGGKK